MTTSMSSAPALSPRPPAPGREPGVYRIPLGAEGKVLYLIYDTEGDCTEVMAPIRHAHERTEDFMRRWLAEVACAEQPAWPPLRLVESTPPASLADASAPPASPAQRPA